jgi:alpha-L-arabinofuranosidase
MQRREFLKSAVTGALVLSKLRAGGGANDSHIELFPNEPQATISPRIYGHFTEHIGGVIYDGVWVGENSPIPNVNGIRKELLARLKQIQAPIIRWPGGCFADSYDWKDGIGPQSQRPARTNFWEVDPDARRLHEKGPQIFDPNSFGTNEFIRFCQLSGAEPYLAANLRSLSALEFDHWVEYCNAPADSTALARLRAASGSREPFNVRYWGVGNESWGCGGNFRPEDYASEFRRFTNWVPEFGQDLQFVASGPNGDDVDWTQRFFAALFTGRIYNNAHFVGWSVHHYSRVRNGDALQFGPQEWYELLSDADRIEKIMLDHWTVMGQYDRDHKIKLVVDEYGSWHRQGTEVDITHIFGQQITMRDAVLTALTLDCFNRHADKVSMANCAQLVNNLNALFLAHQDKFIVTPAFHVFDMYAAHQGAQAIRAEFAAPSVHFSSNSQEKTLWGLKGSASVKGKNLTLTVVNPSVSEIRETQITLHAASARSVAATVLANPDIHAHNSFGQPNAVSPGKKEVTSTGSAVTFLFPPASVTKVCFDLG